MYLGCFLANEFADRDRTCRFQIVVEANSAAEAGERCRARLERLKKTTTLFDDPSTVYLEGLIELAGSFKDGLLVNYESEDTATESFSLRCLIPEQKDHDCSEYGFGPPPKKGADTEAMAPFVDFGGEQVQRVLAARNQGRSTPLESTSASGSGSIDHSPRSSAQTREELRKQRAAERAARQEDVRRNKERKAALRAILDEIG